MRLLFIFGVIWMGLFSQVEAHPLIAMLARVPAGEQVIIYSDYRAAEAARSYQVSPLSYADYAVLDEFDQVYWQWTFNRVIGQPLDMNSHLHLSAPVMQQTVGYDFFDIDRVLTFGSSPNEGVILNGRFDPIRIEQAHTIQAYTPAQINGMDAWCSPNGCDGGGSINLEAAYSGMVFGAQFGRQQTFLMLPDYLISASSYDVLEATSMVTDESGSVLSVPAYRLAAETITAGEGQLIQAHFYPAGSVRVTVDLSEFASRDDLGDALRSGRLTPQMRPHTQWRVYNYGALPPFELAVFADRQEGEQEVAMLVIVYADASQAIEQMPILQRRLMSYSNERRTGTTRPYLDFVQDVTIHAPRLVIGEDAAAVVMSVSLPRVREDVVNVGQVDDELQPGRVYHFWLRAVSEQTFYPLWDIHLPGWYRRGEW